MDQSPHIMAVDDMPYNLEVLELSLADMDANLDLVDSGAAALEMLEKRIPDLILLDIMMPEMDGYELFRRLKEKPETRDIPVIFLSALDDVENKVKALELGAVDFITKPFSPIEVAARVKTHLKLHRMLEEMNTLLKDSFHEIYTPLSIIKSSLTLQEMEYGETEETNNIKAALGSLHSIYEDIYYAVKKEVKAYPTEWDNVKEFIDKRLGLFQAQLNSKGLKSKIIVEAEDAMIKINDVEFERVIDNLLSNAHKYALEESEITITIKEVGEKIEIAIANASKPIKDIKKLFSELYREDHSVMGIGIGLNIVKKICIKHRIDIDVSNEDGVTCFTLSYKEQS